MSKSLAKVKMERALLEAVYMMASESCCPETFENLETFIKQMCETRNLGEFNLFPRKGEG